MGETRGAFQESVDALKGGAGEIGYARPYTTDFLGWFDDFSTTGGGFDALGATARGMITMSPFLHPNTLATKQYRRCPGSAEAPAKDGSNVLSEAEQEALGCTEEHRASAQVRRVLVVLAVLGVCAGAFMLAGAADEGSHGKTYRIKFDNAFGLVKGGDFRVGGVNAGQTTDFEVEKKQGEAPKAVVTVEVSKPGFGDFRKDASCEIRPQSLIGEYYVDCQPGKSEERLPDKGIVPVEQTSSTIPTDIVNDIMRRPYRERFRLIVTELGTGLAGRPDDLQEVLRRAHPGLRETSKVASRPRRPEPGDQELHHGLGHRDQRAREEQARRGALGAGGGRRRRDLGHPPQRAARGLPALPRVPRRASSHDGAPRRAGGRADTAARGPPARRARPRHLLHARGPVLRGEPPGGALARRGG